jgi:hypothetical protein
MDTPKTTENIWQCVGHHPTEWALGTQVGSEMTKIRAAVRRLDDGRWQWEAHPWGYTHRGIQPSREPAAKIYEHRTR